MSFMAKKIASLMKTHFDIEPAYYDKYIKAKIRLHEDEINKNFHGNKIPKENVVCTCYSG